MKNEITIRKVDRLEEMVANLKISVNLMQGTDCDRYSGQEWLEYLTEIAGNADIHLSVEESVCIIDYMKAHNQDDEIIKEQKRCLFEKRLCQYAKRTCKTFECTAPSDEAMECKK